MEDWKSAELYRSEWRRCNKALEVQVTENAELRERVAGLEEAIGEVLHPKSYRVDPDGLYWVYMGERLERLLTDALYPKQEEEE